MSNEIILLRRIEELEKLIQRQPEQGGVWQSYTPVWEATTTNPDIGNGTIVGKYTMIGNTAIDVVQITMGSTTTFGSGAWRIGLHATPDNAYSIGSYYLNDATGNRYAGSVYRVTTNFVALIVDNNSTVVRNDNPFTWAENDTLNFTYVYEIA